MQGTFWRSSLECGADLAGVGGVQHYFCDSEDDEAHKREILQPRSLLLSSRADRALPDAARQKKLDANLGYLRGTKGPFDWNLMRTDRTEGQSSVWLQLSVKMSSDVFAITPSVLTH